MTNNKYIHKESEKGVLIKKMCLEHDRSELGDDNLKKTVNQKLR